MTDAAYLTGQLLLAMPGMGDPRFEHAVIAMCVHDAQGALGIDLSRVHPELSFRDLLANLDIEPGAAPDRPVHIGGPVEPHRGFVLHSPEWADPGTLPVSTCFALSPSLAVLRAIAAGRGPQHWLFALGYAGWGEGQLDGELTRHGWSATAASEAIVFAAPAEARWAAAWKVQGIDPALLASTTGRA